MSVGNIASWIAQDLNIPVSEIAEEWEDIDTVDKHDIATRVANTHSSSTSEILNAMRKLVNQNALSFPRLDRVQITEDRTASELLRNEGSIEYTPNLRGIPNRYLNSEDIRDRDDFAEGLYKYVSDSAILAWISENVGSLQDAEWLLTDIPNKSEFIQEIAEGMDIPLGEAKRGVNNLALMALRRLDSLDEIEPSIPSDMHYPSLDKEGYFISKIYPRLSLNSEDIGGMHEFSDNLHKFAIKYTTINSGVDNFDWFNSTGILEDDGDVIGNFRVSIPEKGRGTTAHIDWLGNEKNLNTGDYRRLIRQLTNEFPRIKHIKGNRISGAKDINNAPSKMQMLNLNEQADNLYKFARLTVIPISTIASDVMDENNNKLGNLSTSLLNNVIEASYDGEKLEDTGFQSVLRQLKAKYPTAIGINMPSQFKGISNFSLNKQADNLYKFSSEEHHFTLKTVITDVIRGSRPGNTKSRVRGRILEGDRRVGFFTVVVEDDEALVDYINMEGLGRKVTLAEMRGLTSDLKRMYPSLKSASGDRISGAKALNSSLNKQQRISLNEHADNLYKFAFTPDQQRELYQNTISVPGQSSQDFYNKLSDEAINDANQIMDALDEKVIDPKEAWHGLETLNWQQRKDMPLAPLGNTRGIEITDNYMNLVRDIMKSHIRFTDNLANRAKGS